MLNPGRGEREEFSLAGGAHVFADPAGRDGILHAARGQSPATTTASFCSTGSPAADAVAVTTWTPGRLKMCATAE